MAGLMPLKGECFSEAVKLARKYQGSLVVHGTVMMDSGNRGPHAWVEHKGSAMDPIAEAVMPIDEYYEIAQAEPEAKYELHKAEIQCLKTGHFGPWHIK